MDDVDWHARTVVCAGAQLLRENFVAALSDGRQHCDDQHDGGDEPSSTGRNRTLDECHETARATT